MTSSPLTPSAWRDVASSRTSGQLRMTALAIAATVSKTCSQLSKISSSFLRRSHCGMDSSILRPSTWGIPISLAMTLDTSSGSLIGRKVGQPHAVGILVEDLCSHLQRQPRLANTAGTKKCQQLVMIQQRLHFLKIVLATAKARLLNREVVGNRIE